MSNGRFRKKENNFTQVSNFPIIDTNLSLKALGLYTRINYYILIPNFDLYKTYLIKTFKEGEASFNSAWNELKKSGFLIQYKMFDDKKRIYWEYELVDQVHTPKNHPMEIPSVEKPPHGKLGVYNKTLSTKTLNNNIFKNSIPQHQQFQQRDYGDEDLFKTFSSNN